MQRIMPCLWLVAGAEEAAKLYQSVFPNTREANRARYSEASAEISGKQKGELMSVDLDIAGYRIQLLNGGDAGPLYKHSPAASLFISCGSSDLVDRIFQGLSPGGNILMDLGEYPFSKRYAFFSDKFGVYWQVMLNEYDDFKVTPSLIFDGDKPGNGSRAKEFYLSLFDQSKSITHEEYKEGEPGKEGNIKYARILLDDSELIIMDSGNESSVEFTGALSLTINCKDQAEVDMFWDRIAKNGNEIQCGWISDEFGVQWQVVPLGLEDMFNDPDPKRVDRTFRAMLDMKKLDIARLRAAADQ